MTVLLETEWILRSVFRLPRAPLSQAIRLFIALPTVRLEHPERVATSLGWFEAGMDFADAMHLAGAGGYDGIATFDRDFIKAAAKIGLTRVAEP